MIAFVIAVAAQSAAAGGGYLPAPPPLFHPRAPVSRTVTTNYMCEDGPRTITLGYEAHRFAEVQNGERRGVALSRQALRRATDALLRLEAVTTIIPECGERSDVLMVLGRAAGRPVLVYLRWSGDTIDASEPEPIGQ
jgi:hypothetical protein